MKMARSFAEVMTRRTDAELIAITSGLEADWQPEAIEAAHKELQARKLSVSNTEQAKLEFLRIQAATEEDLTTLQKFLMAAGAFTCVPGLLVLYLWSRYEKQGKTRKGRAVVRWYLYGLAIYLLLAVVVSLISK
jgi:hypothetical protein